LLQGGDAARKKGENADAAVEMGYRVSYGNAEKVVRQA
jgi:hypothetical protein